MSFNSSVSLFLGAGASRAFGFPTTVEFLDIVKGKVPHKDFFDAVISYIDENLGENYKDIETVLWEIEDFENHANELFENKRFKRTYLLESGNIFQEDQNKNRTPLKRFYENHTRMVKTLRDKIYEFIYHTYWENPQDNQENFRDTYKQLFNQFKNRIFDIFTTNYDLCIENTFWDDDALKPQFTDGFNYDGKDVVFDNNIFDDEKFKYRLFKLHGSLNWKRDPNNRNKITRFNQSDFTSLEDHPILFPGAKYTDGHPFKLLYDNLKKQLLKIPYCIIIGFSFRDEELNNIFANSLKQNDRLKFIIWNKEKPKTQLPDDRTFYFIQPFSRKNIKEFTNFLNNEVESVGFDK